MHVGEAGSTPSRTRVAGQALALKAYPLKAHIALAGAMNLPRSRTNKSSASYVKVTQAGVGTIAQSAVSNGIAGREDATWGEVFEVEAPSAGSGEVKITVFSWDEIRRDDIVGWFSASVASLLEDAEVSRKRGHRGQTWYKLAPPSANGEHVCGSDGRNSFLHIVCSEEPFALSPCAPPSEDCRAPVHSILRAHQTARVEMEAVDARSDSDSMESACDHEALRIDVVGCRWLPSASANGEFTIVARIGSEEACTRMSTAGPSPLFWQSLFLQMPLNVGDNDLALEVLGGKEKTLVGRVVVSATSLRSISHGSLPSRPPSGMGGVLSARTDAQLAAEVPGIVAHHILDCDGNMITGEDGSSACMLVRCALTEVTELDVSKAASCVDSEPATPSVSGSRSEVVNEHPAALAIMVRFWHYLSLSQLFPGLGFTV